MKCLCQQCKLGWNVKIVKDKIIDLCGLGKPWSHYPGDKQFDVQKLIDNYISILEQRSINYQ